MDFSLSSPLQKSIESQTPFKTRQNHSLCCFSFCFCFVFRSQRNLFKLILSKSRKTLLFYFFQIIQGSFLSRKITKAQRHLLHLLHLHLLHLLHLLLFFRRSKWKVAQLKGFLPFIFWHQIQRKTINIERSCPHLMACQPGINNRFVIRRMRIKEMAFCSFLLFFLLLNLLPQRLSPLALALDQLFVFSDKTYTSSAYLDVFSGMTGLKDFFLYIDVVCSAPTCFIGTFEDKSIRRFWPRPTFGWDIGSQEIIKTNFDYSKAFQSNDTIIFLQKKDDDQYTCFL